MNALPLKPHLRVLEVGCGPGVAAREVARRLRSGHILAIDRSAAAIEQLVSGSGEELASGRLRARHCAVEDFELGPDDEPFDLVFAVRVGALDGRHPAAGERALTRIASATKTTARLFIDGGRPLREVHIPR